MLIGYCNTQFQGNYAYADTAACSNTQEQHTCMYMYMHTHAEGTYVHNGFKHAVHHDVLQHDVLTDVVCGCENDEQQTQGQVPEAGCIGEGGGGTCEGGGKEGRKMA